MASGNPQYASPGGLLIDVTVGKLIKYPQGRTGFCYLPDSVSRIGGVAFLNCTGLTGVLLSNGVSEIGGAAFRGCTGLTSTYLPPSIVWLGENVFEGCTALTEVFFSAMVYRINERTFYGCTALTSVSISSSISVIAGDAFSGCASLASITIPASVIVIGGGFRGCPALTTALFLGDAPGLYTPAFVNTAPGFTCYYFSNRTGFTSPTWAGYPSVMINEATKPVALWLLARGFAPNTNLHQDPDGDGVSLLMAYALDLDPRLNLRSSLPVPVLNGNTLSLSFHATSPGVTYRVETSTDLQTWITTGVTQSPPGPDQRSTATVPRDGPSRFLRLAVED